MNIGSSIYDSMKYTNKRLNCSFEIARAMIVSISKIQRMVQCSRVMLNHLSTYTVAKFFYLLPDVPE
jgi:hypothetical protein